MRTSRLALSPLFFLTVWACTSTTSAVDPVGSTSQPIQGGTKDATDTNVVAILIGSGGQVNSLCSGSLIGPNLVLTAHHCVSPVGSVSGCGPAFGTLYGPDEFMVTTSETAAANVFNGAGAMPAADDSTWWSVGNVAVPGDNICGQDMALLTLSAPISGVCPLIPAVDVPITDSETYTAVGFGITSPNGQTAGTRYDLPGGTVSCIGSAECNDNTISATQEWEGVYNGNKGTCEGDSGGPALDSTNRVIGTVSRGPQDACNQTVYEYVYGEATWIKAQAKVAATAGGYSPAGWVTGGATSNPSNGYCGTTTHDAGTKDSGTGPDAAACGGFTTTEPACNQCLDTSCCTQLADCAADNTCVTCITASNPASSCGSNTNYTAAMTCVSNHCATACGGTPSDGGYTSEAGSPDATYYAPDSSSPDATYYAPDGGSPDATYYAGDAAGGNDSAVVPDTGHATDAHTGHDARPTVDSAAGDSAVPVDTGTVTSSSSGSASPVVDAGTSTSAGGYTSGGASTSAGASSKVVSSSSGSKVIRPPSGSSSSAGGGDAGSIGTSSSGGCQAASGNGTSQGGFALAAMAFVAATARRRRKTNA